MVNGGRCSVRDVDADPRTVRSTARELIRGAIRGPRQPVVAVPFNGLSNRSAAEHCGSESCPMKAAHAIRDCVSTASNRHKPAIAPSDRVASGHRSVSATIPIGAVFTVSERMIRVGPPRDIHKTIVLQIIDCGQRNIRGRVVPVNTIVAECQRIASDNESRDHVFAHSVHSCHGRKAIDACRVRSGVIMNVRFCGDSARENVVGRCVTITDFEC